LPTAEPFQGFIAPVNHNPRNYEAGSPEVDLKDNVSTDLRVWPLQVDSKSD